MTTPARGPAGNGPTFVYRFFDETDSLLYVGITMAPHTRWKDHGQRSWWKRVRRVAAVWYPTRVEASVEELRAIREERPEFNVKDAVVERPKPLPVLECRPKPGKRFLRVGEAAEILEVSPATVRRYERDGYLQPLRLAHSRHRRYELADVERLHATGQRPSPPADG